MNDFLKQLENKLDDIDDVERINIIKECKRRIEESIREGKTEDEAIKELGSIDDIVSPHKKTLKDKLNDGIEKSAKFLAEATEDAINYTKEHTKDRFLVTFFEILLKIVILIMIFMLLKIPMLLVQVGLEFVCDLLFYPFNTSLMNIFEYVIAVIYLALCVIASVYMFKGYFEKDVLDKKQISDNNQELGKKEISKHKINYAITIIKILLMIIVIIPMILLSILLLALIALALFLVYKGISVIGLSIILISFLLLTVVATRYITEVIDNKNKNHLFSLMTSILLLITGIIIFADDLMKYEYPDNLESSYFRSTNGTLMLEIDKETHFYFSEGEVEYIVDNNLADNNLLIEVTYYDQFVDITYEKDLGEENDIIIFSSKNERLEISDYIYMYEIIIKDLQEDKLFNYGDLDNYQVRIYCNETTRELVK